MNENPLISIIVPVYNGETFLKECVDSILGQTYKNIELILINDGSKDNSAQIIDEYAQKDERVVAIHQENSGVCASRNNGLRNAHGEYICLIDQDDYVFPDYISYLYTLIKENNADVSLTPTARKINKDNKNNIEEEKDDYIEVITGEQAAKEMLCYNFIIAPWNKMISRELIEKNNIRFDEQYFGGEGFLFSIDCYTKTNRVALGHRKVYNYRCDNPNSGMTKFRMQIVESSEKSQQTIKEHVLAVYSKLSAECKYSNWHTYCDCYNFFVGCNVIDQYKEKYKEIKKVCKKDALCALKVNIPKKEKIKAILYFISPYLTAKFINHFRVRRFTKEQ